MLSAVEPSVGSVQVQFLYARRFCAGTNEALDDVETLALLDDAGPLLSCEAHEHLLTLCFCLTELVFK